MGALGYDLLDRHVVAGMGDAPASVDESGSLSFAELLARTAAFAGGLAVLGVGPGQAVGIRLPSGHARVVAVCAVIRLGAIPAEDAEVRIEVIDGAEVIQVRGESVEFQLVERAGRSEPAPAFRTDASGYSAVVGDSFADIVEPLLSGSPVV
jgi:non-ribosomal peptide synthetase component F